MKSAWTAAHSEAWSEPLALPPSYCCFPVQCEVFYSSVVALKWSLLIPWSEDFLHRQPWTFPPWFTAFIIPDSGNKRKQKRPIFRGFPTFVQKEGYLVLSPLAVQFPVHPSAIQTVSRIALCRLTLKWL